MKKLTLGQGGLLAVLLIVPATLLLVPLLLPGQHKRLTLFDPFPKARADAERLSCQINLKQIGRGFAMYAQDYGNKFPPTAGGSIPLLNNKLNNKKVTGYKPSLGWADTLQPYIQSQSVYQCHNDSSWINWPRVYTDYWLNARLSGASKRTARLPAATLLVGEGSDGTDKTDATYSKSRLPSAWITDQNSPAWRHLEGANYLFVDGHVAWLKPDEVTNCYGRNDCFALK